ncbi:MAG: hybrid sensor histidine kinase/response regulator, partial [Lentisphaerae bacterium]|nr:hybrid sensor histidine kinase/response regulator [Lentisphaerota bacterium]
SMRFQAEQKSLVLNVTIPDRRWFVDCDAAKIERVVLNVVGNALKFTPERGRIDVTVEDDPDRARHVRVSVQDSGVGIPPAALSKVTLRYFTVGEQPSGSGLGLAISKEIVDLHGGVLTIQSPPPGHARGTVVRFSLPLSEPPLVLIVSRNAETAAVLREPLAREGYRIAIRRDVETAVTDLMNEDSSMVVLDFTESDALGTGIVTRVKGTKALVNRPLVALTGPGSSEAARKIVRTFAIAELHDRTNESALCKLVADAFLR